MKSFRKFFAILCIICLLFSFANVVAVGDETATPSIEIKFYNLQFGNQVYILYAVDVQNVDTTVTPFMQYWTEEPTDATAFANPSSTSTKYEYRTLTDDSTETQKYYVFAYTNLTAKQMADVIYARACVTVGDKTYYSDVESFSICEYVAIQLGIADGYTATTNENLKNMLLSMLDYGTNAQKYFNYRTDCLANDFYKTFAKSTELTPTADITYKLNAAETAYTATGYTGEETVLIIAKTYNGKPVTAIGEGAFSKRTYTEIVIQEGVTTIGDKAFESCKNLTSLTLPSSVTKIGNLAFPDNEYKLTITYSGTKEQLATLLKNNFGWNSDVPKYFMCSDGKTYKVTASDLTLHEE